MTESAGTDLPLAGIRVLDLSRILAGPHCTMLLGDLGAEVIKVERPGVGDDTRTWGPPFAGGESAYYLCCNRNKKSITIDLKKPEGTELVRKLAAKSDVFLENFTPGLPRDFGLDYDTLKEINPRLIGLIGHSEGGTIASLAAARSPDVSYIVMMGSPGLPGVEYNYQYEESMGRALGLSEEAIAAKRAFQERVLNVVLHEKDYAIAEEKLRRIYQEFDPNISDMQEKTAVKRLLSPWFRFSVAHDPGDTLRAVKCPVLAITGEKDVHVPPDGNIEAIRHALETGGNRDYTVEELPGLNHFFQTAETGAPLEYGKIEETISPIVLELVGIWILEHVKGRG